MAKKQSPEPVKLICPALARDDGWFERAEVELQDEFGPVDLTSETWDFDYTDYYTEEMGEGLKRRIYSFRKLIDPGELAAIKNLTNEKETRFADKSSGNRAVNLDPGYISHSKLVLASTKNYSHRIYIGEGIFAEITLEWHKNNFEPLKLTYPDYRTNAYRDFFALVRSVYASQVEKECMCYG